jgi:hypothetical protein
LLLLLLLRLRLRLRQSDPNHEQAGDDDSNGEEVVGSSKDGHEWSCETIVAVMHETRECMRIPTFWVSNSGLSAQLTNTAPRN